MSCAYPRLRSSLWSLLFITSVYGAPTISFPINAQIPPVSRIGEQFEFTFNQNTFTTNGQNSTIAYSLQNQPSWLKLEASQNTLIGTPGPEDVGSATAQLVATDASGSSTASTFTLVIVDPKSQPMFIGNVTNQLEMAASSISQSTNQTLAAPDALTVHVGSTFDLAFNAANTFSNPTIGNGSPQWYSAISSDHSPLPAWVQFHTEASSSSTILHLTGTPPASASWPQVFGIRIIASTAAGFEGAGFSFRIVTSQHQLAFKSLEQYYTVQADQPFRVDHLLDGLMIDGQQISSSSVVAADITTLPAWLTFDPASAVLRGNAPSNATSFSANLSAIDVYGDQAITQLHFSANGSTASSAFMNNASIVLFTGTIPRLNAIAGSWFQWTFPSSLVNDQSAQITLNLGPEASQWLSFNSQNNTLSGNVPQKASAGILSATVTARTANGMQSEPLSINLESAENASGTGSGSTSGSSASSSTPHSSIHGGALAAAIIVPLLVVILFLLACFCVHRRRKQRANGGDAWHEGRSKNPRAMSSPFLCHGAVKHDRNQGFGEQFSDAALIERGLYDDRMSGGNGVHQKEMTQVRKDPAPRISAQEFGRFGNSLDMAGGRDLSPEELAVLRSQNRTSGGSAALRGHTPSDAMKIASRLARKSLALSSKSNDDEAERRMSMPLPRRPRSFGRRTPSGLGHGRLSRSSWSRLPSPGPENLEDRVRKAGGYSSTRASLAPSEVRGSFETPPVALSVVDEGGASKAGRLELDDQKKRKSIRMINSKGSLNEMMDRRPFEVRRQSYISRRASNANTRPLFSAENRQSRNSSLQSSLRTPSSRFVPSLRRPSAAHTRRESNDQSHSDADQNGHTQNSSSRSSMWTSTTSDGSRPGGFGSSPIDSVPEIPERFMRDENEEQTAAGRDRPLRSLFGRQPSISALPDSPTIGTGAGAGLGGRPRSRGRSSSPIEGHDEGSSGLAFI